MSEPSRISRREVLRGLGSSLTLVAGSAFLAACGGGATSPTSAPPAAAASPTAAAGSGSAAPTASSQAAAPTTAPSSGSATAQPAATAGGSSAEKVTLAYWFWANAQGLKDEQKIADAFMATHPNIQVQLVSISSDDIATKFETAVASGTEPETFWVKEAKYYDWASSGLFLDQLSYLKGANVDPKAYWHPQAQWWFKGKYYATSTDLETMILHYNVDLFKKLDVPEPPYAVESAWRWDDFITTARKLTTDSKGRHPGDGGFDPKHVDVWGASIASFWGYLPFVSQSGALPFGTDFAQSHITDPGFTDLFQAIADLALKDQAGPTPGDLAGTDQWTSYQTGKLGMFIDGNWDLYTFTDKPKFTTGVALLPVYDKAYKTAVEGAPNAISSKAQHPDQAFAWSFYVEDNGNALVNLQSGLWEATTNEYLFGAKRKLWVDDYPQHHPPHYAEVVLDTLKLADQPQYKYFAGYYDAWYLTILPALDEVLAGKVTAKDAMAKINPQINDLLQKVNKQYPPSTPE